MNAPKTLPAVLTPASGLWNKGKAQFKFFKTGIANVWQNRAVKNEVLKRTKAANGFALARALVEYSHLAAIEAKATPTGPKRAVRPSATSNAAPQPGLAPLTRLELQTVLRTERDWPKLPAFAVIFAVFLELTPFALLAVPRLAPSTCYSAGFRSKENTRREAARNQMQKLGNNIDCSCSVYRLARPELEALAAACLPGSPVMYRYLLPLSSLRARLQRHLVEVRADDVLLRQLSSQGYSKIDELDDAELHEALNARAVEHDDIIDTPTRQAARQELKRWVQEFKEPADAGYFWTQKID